MNFAGELKPQSNRARLLFIAAAVVIILAAGVCGYLVLHKGKDTQANKNAAESSQIIADVGKLYILPTGETPTVASIQDKTKLAGQDFFKDAQNGDYVLVYPKAKTALLYRKSVNKLVNVGPITLGNNANNSASSGQ